jgi:capsular polysaccharide transport system permease protein
VIGALIMRELHTRFGRDNVGYLWMFIEPMLFSSAVAAMHIAVDLPTMYGMEIGPFYFTGYTPFIIFRSIVSRAPATIESNAGLLYHRRVTILDLLFARGLLDLLAVTFSMFVLLAGAAALDLGHLPDRPLLVFAGLALVFWLSWSLSLVICVVGELSTATERLIHPATYFSMPLSGVFFVADQIPEPFRGYLLWCPLLHPIQLIREGEFGTYNSDYTDVPYVVAWCMGLTLIGLLALRLVRSRVHIE